MIYLVVNVCSSFKNVVRLVYNRILAMKQSSFVLMWRSSVLALYEYLTFKRL